MIRKRNKFSNLKKCKTKTFEKGVMVGPPVTVTEKLQRVYLKYI